MARHLTFEEREAISQMHYAGHSQVEIARKLGRDPGTISRELRRNSRGGRYNAVWAQRLTEQRHREARRKSRKMDRPEVRDCVLSYLQQWWSPDEIAGQLRADSSDKPRPCISHETIYRFLRRKENRRVWGSFLRGHRPRIRRPRRIPGAARIAHRPEVINRRERFGDWEGDTMLGSGRRDDGALMVLVERRSGYVHLRKVLNRQSATVIRAAEHCLEQHPAHLRLSCTFDNGAEFTEHARLQKLGLETYFADPHSPWQRGTNENTIRLVRQFIPKGMSIRGLSHHEVARIETLLNERPRKRLGYRTPREVFWKQREIAFQT